MVNVIKVPAKTETKVVEIEPEKYVLELNEREALIIQTLVANTKWSDPVFPEVTRICKALNAAGLDYYGQFTLDRTRDRRDPIHLVAIPKPQRVGTNEEW